MGLLKLIKYLILIFLFCFLALAFIQNQDTLLETIDFKLNLFFAEYKTYSLPIVFYFFIIFIIGLIAGSLLFFKEYVKMRKKMREIKKEGEVKNKTNIIQ